MATLKTILDSVLAESGFLLPASYTSSTNPDDAQLVALANAASDDISELGLSGARRFASIALDGSTGSYALPTDFLAYVPDTAYVGSQKVDFPVTPQEWADPFQTGYPQWRSRIMQGLVTTESGPATMVFEYLSSYPWEASDNTPLREATADTDRWLLDDRLLKLAIKWRWKKEKGIEDWQVDQQLYQRQVNLLRGRDGGAKALQFGDPAYFFPAPYTPTWV